ncbi:hypothetical protein ColLi_12682 [Colletotrichum liriopes]|uniref:Uncharacterized protein n=1 Tax=Colletotrichum liriopes TaxID=708192 RepID=A0AA37LYY0_9PEZI|nr:hypothetical protein ColLi_12682 [Colletotrichum liriopes]
MAGPFVNPLLRATFGAILSLLGLHPTATDGHFQRSAVLSQSVTTIQAMSPYARDMHGNAKYLSAVSMSPSSPGVAMGIVDESQKQEGLVSHVMTRTGIPQPPLSPSPLAFFLVNVANAVDDMRRRDGDFHKRVGETISSDYNEARNLLFTHADDLEVAGPTHTFATRFPAGPFLWPWTVVECWVTGQTRATRRLRRHLAAFEHIIDEASRTVREVVDIFHGNDSNAELDESADVVQRQVCRLDKALGQAVGIGKFRLHKARRSAERDATQVAVSDVVLLGKASHELRAMEAVGSMLCLQARSTAASLQTRRDVVLDLPRKLRRLGDRLAGASAFGEEAARVGGYWDDDVAAEESRLLGLINEFLQAMDETYFLV